MCIYVSVCIQHLPPGVSLVCYIYFFFGVHDDVNDVLQNLLMPIPLSLRVPLPLRPTFSWTAVTTIFASPTSNSQPPCKTDMTTPSDLNLWTLNTPHGQTQTHMHAQLNQRNYVCYSSHNEQSLHCIAHIIVPFTMWCVRAFVCTCMCVCVYELAFSL